MSDLMSLPKFDYEEVPIQELTCDGTWSQDGRLKVKTIQIRDKKCQPTQRFWDSLMSRFGFGSSIFKYFTHKEVFDRIHEKERGVKIRIALQNTPSADDIRQNAERQALIQQALAAVAAATSSNQPELAASITNAMGTAMQSPTPPPPDVFLPKLLSVSDPTKGILFIEEALAVLNRMGAHEVEYREGIIVTKHDLRRPLEFEIGGDKFTSKLALETPIDGYGKPTIYLSTKCETTGANLTAYTKIFQSGVILGGKDSAAFTLERAVSSYSNEDGFSALKQRLESSKKAWASVHEVMRLTKILWKLENEDFSNEFIAANYNTAASTIDQDRPRNDIVTELYNLAGDLRAIYSVAQIDSISLKRMKALPAKCKVYDLIQFATNIASKKLRPEAAKKIQSLVGEYVSSEYDLEESATRYGTFEDFVNSSQRDRFRKKDDE